MSDALKKQWIDLCYKEKLDESLALKAFDDIIERYSEGHRYYHNVQHLEHLFEVCEKVRGVSNTPSEVLFALFYHDVIYKIGGQHNEQESADLAANTLSELNWPQERVQEVKRYIEATTHHQGIEGDDELNFFLDLDMSILGENPERYQQYRQQIREENAWIPKIFFNRSRRKFLKGVLERNAIYNHTLMHDMFEEAARRNIQKELAEF